MLRGSTFRASWLRDEAEQSGLGLGPAGPCWSVLIGDWVFSCLISLMGSNKSVLAFKGSNQKASAT